MRISLFAPLIILPLVAASVLAQEPSSRSLTYGDWTVIQSGDKEDLIASTMQDSDKFLGYRCFTKTGKCVHIIITATTCTDGQNYPLLINASSGSLMTTCLCSNNQGTFELFPTDWDNFHSILRDATGYIGFAIPLASGQFKVVRFSLTGAKAAIEAAESAIRKRDSAEYK